MSFTLPQQAAGCRRGRTSGQQRRAPSASAVSRAPPPPHAASCPSPLRSAPRRRVSSAALPLWELAEAVAESPVATDTGGYSNNSYYATLGLFLISFPGLYSLVTRSAKSKIERKVFEVPGPAVEGAMPLDARAKALFAFFKRNNYAVSGEPGEVISFVGLVAPERGTAAYITFCAFVGLGSAALVLSIAQPAIGDSAYWLTALSPAAGAYYWRNAGRKETMKLKIVTADDDRTTDVTIEGDAQEIERCARELDLVEKGKIKVKGILEPSSA